MYQRTGLGDTTGQAQCPPQFVANGSDCLASGTNVTWTPAQAWGAYNQWITGVNQTAAYDTQRVLPKVLAEGGAALALLMLAPGAWKLTAVIPAFLALMTYSLKGGL